MTNRTITIPAGILSLALLLTLILKLTTIPGGIILSGLFLGGMVLVLILISCLLVAYVLRLIFKIKSFWTAYFLTTIVSFVVFHYKLYSPTLTIVVPVNYTGEVDLVLSNVTENILKLDSNGIGYVNEWTFDKTYTRPIVVNENGESLDSHLVGFSPNTFWALGKSCCVDNKEVYSKGFEIKSTQMDDQSKGRILTDLIDLRLTKTIEPDRHTMIQTNE
jgi:hypothetical protein